MARSAAIAAATRAIAGREACFGADGTVMAAFLEEMLHFLGENRTEGSRLYTLRQVVSHYAANKDAVRIANAARRATPTAFPRHPSVNAACASGRFDMNALTKVLLALACACCVALCIEGMAPKPACALEPMSLSDEMKYFAKYESSQNYAQTFSSGDDYNAMGYYQFDRRYGLRDFMQTCYDDHPHIFKALGKALEYSSGDFKNKDVVYTDDDGYVHFTSFGVTLNAAWKAAYKSDPELFAGYQDAWAYQQYYRPVQRIMKSRYGIDLSERSDCIKGLCWGMCNLFGQTGCLYFFDKAGLSAGMSDRQFARAACNAVVDNVAARYPSQPQYHQGWQNRYKKELADCLGYLGQWIQKAGGWTFVVKGKRSTAPGTTSIRTDMPSKTRGRRSAAPGICSTTAAICSPAGRSRSGPGITSIRRARWCRAGGRSATTAR